MTWIDWVIAGFVLFAAVQGLRRGILAAGVGLLALLAAYLIASAWYRPLAGVIQQFAPLSPQWSATVAFAAILLLVYEGIAIITLMAISGDEVPFPSRVLGMAVGALRGVMLVAALLVVALASPPSQPLHQDVNRSTIAPYAVTAYRGSMRALAGILPPAVQPFGTEDGRF